MTDIENKYTCQRCAGTGEEPEATSSNNVTGPSHDAALVNIVYSKVFSEDKYSHIDRAKNIITALRPYLSDGKDKARIAELEKVLGCALEYVGTKGDPDAAAIETIIEVALKSEETT